MLRLFSLVVWITSIHASRLPTDMLAHMDYTINPCVDFYQHACGKWIETNRLGPMEKQRDIAFQPIQKRNTQILHDILETKPPILHEFWTSCIHFGENKQYGKAQLQEDFKSIVQTKTKSDILALAGEFTRTGTNVFTTFQVRPDDQEKTFNSLYLLPADLPLPVNDHLDSYENDQFKKFKKDYRIYIKELVRLSGFSLFKKQQSVASTVMEIEQKLAAIKRHRDTTIRRETLQSVFHDLPITIGAYVHGLGIVETASITEQFTIHIENPHYFIEVENLIKTTSIQDLQVYLAYILLHSRAQWLDKQYYQAWSTFYQQDVPSSRVDTCINSLLYYTPDLIGKYYTEKRFNAVRQRDVMKMTKLLNNSMSRHIMKTSWMSPDEKQHAQTKLHQMKARIGYPKEFQTYPDSLSPLDYSTNVYTLLRHHYNHKMKQIGQPTDRMEWKQSQALANPSYDLSHNALEIPAGILQPPLYNGPKVHPARNYGAIGAIIGHQITHGFDRHGCSYDGQGKKETWWSDMTFKLYGICAQCFEKSYSSFQVKGETIDGTLTLDENIADSGGLALAWDAYRQHIATIPKGAFGVDEDEGDRMFFIAYAQTWCTNVQDEYMMKRLQQDQTAPPKYRVNGALMHNDEFNEVFRCDLQMPMNPVKKCRIW